MTQSVSSPQPQSAPILAVRLGEALHGIPIAAVEEVLPALPVAPLPDCPDFVRGVVFVRGQLIPVLDAAERLGLQAHQRPAEPHVVCVRTAHRLIGVEVDEAVDLIEPGSGDRLSSEDLGAARGFFSAVIEREGTVIRILDPSKLIDASEASALEQIPGVSPHDS